MAKEHRKARNRNRPWPKHWLKGAGRRYPLRILVIPAAALMLWMAALASERYPDLFPGFLQEVRTDDPTSLPRVLRGGGALNSRTTSAPQSAIGHAMSGKVSHVRDGDTIEVAGTPIRIAALDCAEKGTAQGNAATRRMRQLVFGERLTCTLSGRRSYDREVGSCRLQDGRDIAAIMITEGACRRWR
ncbi:thermonuclease family protein [Roseovarius sp. D0-M9]|uniref:thermonuclease family protein n=1 Tax=Roseovarius sp. D0-M9 TaxID=3127117 RepID=UPI0030104A0C